MAATNASTDATADTFDEAQQFDALERKVQEIEALEAIYDGIAGDGGGKGDDGDDGEDDDAVRFILKSGHHWDVCRSIQQQQRQDQDHDQDHDKQSLTTPTHQGCEYANTSLDIEFQSSRRQNRIQFHLPIHYPLVSAQPTVLQIEGWTRKDRQALQLRLQSTARELVGMEAIWELNQQFHEQLLEHQQEASLEGSETTHLDSVTITRTRCWIWVHHIVDKGRCKDIVREAKDSGLHGYLKSGYPGIVVVEGPTTSVEEYVSWVKGNKSRPGGFGRNWGHHVRGEVRIPSEVLPRPFAQLGDELRALAEKCKSVGLGDEFLAYVMQHTKKGTDDDDGDESTN